MVHSANPQATTSLGLHAALWAFMSAAGLAVAAAGVVTWGAGGGAQARLATASVQALSGLQDICTASTASTAVSADVAPTSAH